MLKASIIILAGGMGRRFQRPQQPWRDKALEVVDGKPMLWRVVEAALSFTDEVVITVNSLSRKSAYENLLKGLSGVKVAIDENGTASGPLVGLKTGLKWSTAERCVSVPCDAPFTSPSLLGYLAKAVEDAHVAVPVWGSGRLEPLFLALRREPARLGAEILVKLGRKRPDDLVRIGLKTRFIPMDELKDFDPGLKTFINVNYPEDLIKQPTNTIEGAFKAVPRILNGHQVPVEALRRLNEILPLTSVEAARSIEDALAKSAFITGALYEQVGFAELKRNTREAFKALKQASLQYLVEAEFYEGKSLLSLAGHALMDAYRCLKPLSGAEAEAALSRALATYAKIGLKRKG